MRAAIYCRVSTGRQDEDGTSLLTQEEECRRYALAKGYAILEDHVYQEVFTGAELWDRPRLTALRDAIRLRQIDVLVVYAIDRLSRDPVHLGVILTEADHRGVTVEFVTEELDNSPEAELIRFVRGYAAKVEHEKIRERSIRGKRALLRAGVIATGGMPPYGYRLSADRTRRIIHEPEARVVRDIFHWYAVDGVAMSAIARRLNRAGIPAPSAGKRAHPDGRVPRWSGSTVRFILKNEAYTGVTYAWKWEDRRSPTLRARDEWLELPPETTPALITPQFYRRVQQRLATNRGERARNRARPCLLRGLIFCAVCERRLWVDAFHGRLYYRCPSRDQAGASCGATIVQAAPADEWAWQETARRLLDPRLIDRERRGRTPQNGRDVARQLKTARASLAKITAAQERILARYGESESIPWELVEREIARGEREKDELRRQIAELEGHRARQLRDQTQQARLEDWCARVAANLETMTFDERRQTLETLAVRVYASGFEYAIALDPQEF